MKTTLNPQFAMRLKNKFLQKMFYLLVLFSGMTFGQIVNIPDANFKAKLLSASPSNTIAFNSLNVPIKIDINDDNQIQLGEALTVSYLNVSLSNIADLSGIQNFNNMKHLNCGNNNLTSFTLNNLLNLEVLQIDVNSISILNLNGLTNLKEFSCSGNSLTSLDSSIFPNLQYLDCSSNSSLINLNLTNLSNLTKLRCQSDSLNSLNISTLINLNYLACGYNNLTVLDVSNLTSLQKLYSDYNILTSLNVSGANNLQILNVDNNNLTNIDISNLTHLNEFSCKNNNTSSLNFDESNSITKFDCSNNQLTNLNFSYLTNVVEIYCGYNQLTFLDVHGLIHLETLNCGNNLLSSLNFDGLSNLRFLYFSDNNVTSVLLSGLSNIKYIYCNNNHLTSFNLQLTNTLLTLECDGNNLTSINTSVFPNINTLSCGNNQLTSLSINTLLSLSYLGIINNQITEIDFNGLSNLQNVACQGNQFLTLDFIENTSLQGLTFFNNPMLTSVFMKNGKNETIFFANSPSDPPNLPNLLYICADDSQIMSLHNQLDSFGLSSTVCNSYCSFTPGGNHNTISGAIKFDANNNGCDASDLPQPNIRININDGTAAGATFTNNQGTYNFYTQTGSFNLTPDTENPTWFTISPATATIPFADNNNNTTTQNFCIAANGTHTDVEVVIEPSTNARPGFDAVYKIVYKNKGNQAVSGNVIFNYNDAFLDDVSVTVIPNSQSTGVMNWSYTNLLPFENRSFYVTLHVNAPTDTPAVNIGDVLNFNVAILNNGDENPSDNTFTYNQTVVGSFDPNNITCLEGDIAPISNIGSYLHYGVNFENTGTYPAENIVVKVVIDITKYDVNSLQMLNTSNPAYTKITENAIEFIFQNIMLESGGHGNVLFKIKTKNNLVNGDMVSKNADIFFDYNVPINTGMANTTFQLLNNGLFVIDDSIVVSPNPSSSNININSNFNIKSIQVYDIQGRLLETKLVEDVTTTINLSDKTNGIYFLKITTDTGSKVEKIVKE